MNSQLDGTNYDDDFYIDPLFESNSSGAQMTLTEAQLPEPATFGMVALASLAMLCRRRAAR